MAKWQCMDFTGTVPTWSGDGDGLFAIEHCTPENRGLESRFPEGKPRSHGYVGWHELELVGVWQTLAEATQELSKYAAASGQPEYFEPGTVRYDISPAWVPRLANNILDCPSESCVGSGVLTICRAADDFLAVRCQDGGGLEESTRAAIIDATVGQCNVWYFG